MGKKAIFKQDRVLRYFKPQDIKKWCPKEINISRYILYKLSDDAFPDVGYITKEFYNRPYFVHIDKSDDINILEKLIGYNFSQRNILIDLVTELCFLPDLNSNKIEEIFSEYNTILRPICAIYKLCYIIPIIGYALENRFIKDKKTGELKKTVIGKSFFVYRVINYTNGKLTKNEALTIDIWNEKIMKNLENNKTIEKISCRKVEGHPKELKSDRFVNKKDQTIYVGPYVQIRSKKNKAD